MTSRPPLLLDELERRIVAALQIDPRASWSQLSSAVGVSETTVLRRVQRMREAGQLIVTAAPDPLRCGLGQPAMVYFRTVPGHSAELAHQLARRPDVRYVALLAGVRDVMCELIARDHDHLTQVITKELPGAGSVLSSTTAVVLRQFKTDDEWSTTLLDEHTAAGRPKRPGRAAPTARVRNQTLDELDTRLVAALSADGRRTYADLSQELELSETAVARRIVALRKAKRVSFLAMVDPVALGFDLDVIVHLRTEPARLASAAAALAGTKEARYVSATTGMNDLICNSIFADTDELYDFVTGTVGTIRGITDVDVDVVLESVKRQYRYPLFTADVPVLEPAGTPQLIRAPRAGAAPLLPRPARPPAPDKTAGPPKATASARPAAPARASQPAQKVQAKS